MSICSDHKATNMDPQSPPPSSSSSPATATASISASQLLHLAESHLRLRNYTLSASYSLELLNYSPSTTLSPSLLRLASQLLAVADILSQKTLTLTTPNWYSVLRLDTFSDDLTLIRSHFKHLLLLLNNNNNSSDSVPFSADAVDLLFRAWSVLSNPSKKSNFDSELRIQLMKERGRNGDGGGSFWTFCPYCCYVYEYAIVFEGCCLRCRNEKCRRTFHGVSIRVPRDWERRNGNGEDCFGFYGYFPIGYSGSGNGGMGMAGFDSWSPIVNFVAVKDGQGNVNVNVNANAAESDVVLETRPPSGANAEGMKESGDLGKGGDGSVRKGVKMRKKSVARNTKKMMGTGRGYKTNANASSCSPGYGKDGSVDVDGEVGFGEMGVGGVGGVEFDDKVDVDFFEQDGELFVGVPSDDRLF